MATITAKQVSTLLVPLLIRMVKLIGTVSRIPAGEFSGRNGATVTVAVPQPTASRTQAIRSADITFDDISEVAVDVTLEHEYNGKLISDEEYNLDLENFGRQITKPQVAAVVTGAEGKLATVMNDMVADASFALNASQADTKAQLEAMMVALDEADVPESERYLACSPTIAARLLNIDELIKANEAGMSQSPIRTGVIGEAYGFTIVKTNALTAGTAVAYHSSGFVWANTAPVVPSPGEGGGSVDGKVSSESGVSLRQIFQYLSTKLSNTSVVSTFAGASLVDADRVYKLDTAVA